MGTSCYLLNLSVEDADSVITHVRSRKKKPLSRAELTASLYTSLKEAGLEFGYDSYVSISCGKL